MSVFVKPNGRSGVTLYPNGGGSGAVVDFNLLTESVSVSSIGGASVSADIESLSNGWFRLSVFVSLYAPTSLLNFYGYFSDNPSNGNGTYTGDGASGVYVWGAQVDQGALTDYKKTTSAAKSVGKAILSEPLDWSAGGSHVLAFRKPDGSVAGPYQTSAGTDLYRVTLTDWDDTADPTPYTGSAMERAHYAFGPTNLNYIRARVLAVRPKSAETVEIYSVVEADAVHTADTGTSPDAVTWLLPSRNTLPLVLGLKVTSAVDDVNTMMLSWQPSAGADHYLIEQSNGTGSWIRCGEPTSSSYPVRAIYGSSTIVRVAAVGITRGPWISINYAGVADYMWVEGDDDEPMWVEGDDTEIMWS